MELVPSTQADPIVTARLSNKGFGDFWDETSGEGFYGNWMQDEDSTMERFGALPVGMASTYGAGRVVVVGDQNMFGDVWLHMTDNFEHWLNIHAWLAPDASRTRPLRYTDPSGTSVAVDMFYSDYRAGNTSAENYYTFYVNLNRDPELTGRGVLDLNKKSEALILPPARVPYDAQGLEDIHAALKQGKRVVMLMELGDLFTREETSPTYRLLQELAPDFDAKTPDRHITFSDAYTISRESFRESSSVKKEGILDVTSDFMSVAGIKLGNYPTALEGQTPPPYYLDVTSTWGEAFISSRQGADIARIKAIDNGELIIFLQDGFWRNRTLGKSEVQRPQPHALPALELQYQLMDYLKRPVS